MTLEIDCMQILLFGVYEAMLLPAETHRPFAAAVAGHGYKNTDWELGIRNFRFHMTRKVIVVTAY